MKKKLSNELLRKIEKQIRAQVMEKEKNFQNSELLTQSKEITIESLADVSELPREEIEKISKQVYAEHGYTNIEELEKINKKIALLEKTKELIEIIAIKISGFKGYVEKIKIQDADKMIRDFMCEKLWDYKNKIIIIMKDYQKKGQLELLTELDSLSLLMERVAKKCRYADYISTKDQSGEKKREAVQYKILAYDWNLIIGLEKIDEDLQSLETGKSGKITKYILNIKNRIQSFEESFEKRKKTIIEVL